MTKKEMEAYWAGVKYAMESIQKFPEAEQQPLIGKWLTMADMQLAEAKRMEAINDQKGS